MTFQNDLILLSNILKTYWPLNGKFSIVQIKKLKVIFSPTRGDWCILFDKGSTKMLVCFSSLELLVAVMPIFKNVVLWKY